MSATLPPLIAVESLEKHYRDGPRALQGINLTVSRGEVVILLGPNGSGKSTLLRCLNLLEQPTAGRIRIDGLDLATAARADLRRCRRRIGVVFQRFNLVPGMSAFQNVLFGAMGRHGLLRTTTLLAPAALRQEAMACLARVNLADKAAQRADTLSGGQQQRVAIARMLMQDPEIVLADEPIASLDPKAGRDVMNLLWDVARERGLTVICTLHHLDLAREYGGRLIGLQQGRMVLDVPARDAGSASFDFLYTGQKESAHA
jgi:phosphonate transport system ATP-binding protein